ncbi:MAG: hypothetical protein PHV05_04840 [Candidatus Riflebacteria bacterium]|nr:hypothetical protein [Candidatus Riflebacteria bacterium]
MTVEIEKVSHARQYEVFMVVNEYLAATLRGTDKEVEQAWKALVRLQETND